MKAKKALIQRSIFSKLPTNFVKTLIIFFELVYTNIIKKIVDQALVTQRASKISGLD